MEKEGLRTALMDACITREQDLEIGEIREAVSGTRSATVRVNKNGESTNTEKVY